MFAKRKFLGMLAVLLSVSVLAGGQTDNLNDFVRLLVQEDKPTIEDFYEFYGRGSEVEIHIEMSSCLKDQTNTQETCVQFHKLRFLNSAKEKSLFFDWIRNEFNTKNQESKVISVDSSKEGYNLITVIIGSNEFILYEQYSKKLPPLKVTIRKINGVDIDKYINQQFGD